MSELIIDANTRIQILDEIEHLARARKHQYAAFIRSEAVLCVWADHVEAVIPAAEALEESLIQFIWRGEEENKKINQAMRVDEAEKEESLIDEDVEDVVMRRLKRHWRERPVMLWAPLADGLSIMLCIGLISLGVRTLIKEFMLDGKYLRFTLMIILPPLFWVASFACMCAIGSLVSKRSDVVDGSSKSLVRYDRSHRTLATSAVSHQNGPWAS